MKLTPKEKAQVYRAAEMIANERGWFSCSALVFSSPTAHLANKYAIFYGRNKWEDWGIDDEENGMTREQIITWRILLLIFFAEAWEGE